MLPKQVSSESIYVKTRPAKPLVSIVLPAFNEEATLQTTISRISDVMQNLDITYEIIVVNDGSSDQTKTVLEDLVKRHTEVKAIHFSRNFGHQIAVTAGVDHAIGDVVVLMDADLQDPPELIEQFLEKWREGYDVVYAVRQKREGESWFKKISAHLFYRVLRAMTDIDIPMDTGDFRLMSREVALTLSAIRERHRFIRGMIAWMGFRQIGVPYERQERFAGESKYPLRKMIRFSIDGITSFSFRPLQFATHVGVFVAFCGFLGMLAVLYEKIFTRNTVQGWTSLMLVVLFLGGIQLILLGVVGEYIGRIYDEVRGRPMYIVEQRSNLNHSALEQAQSINKNRE